MPVKKPVKRAPAIKKKVTKKQTKSAKKVRFSDSAYDNPYLRYGPPPIPPVPPFVFPRFLPPPPQLFQQLPVQYEDNSYEGSYEPAQYEDNSYEGQPIFY